MGVNTIGELRGRLEVERLLGFIKSSIDENATLRVIEDKRKFVKKDTDWVREVYDIIDDYVYSSICHINFKYNRKNITLTYIYASYNSYENLEYYKPLGLEDMVKSETTYLSMYHCEESIEAMKEIVSNFGGWIDDNDCDDKEFYYIEKGVKTIPKPIRKVTLNEVYEKFGEVVIIEDY